MKTIGWRHEPKGPGLAFHMFLDAGGERVELLAYNCAAAAWRKRMCRFEIFARERPGGPFHNQVAAGEADSLEAAMNAGRAMAEQPRDTWTKL